MSDYQPRVGSTADLTLQHLRAHGATGEIALAAAIDKEAGELGALLSWPIKQGAIKKAVVGDEWVYDLGDGIPVAQPIDLRKNTPQQGANRDASAGQSHGAGESESSAGRGTSGAPALGAAPVFPMVASRAGPASDGSQKPNGDGPRSSTAPAKAGSNTPRRDSQHVLKATAARPDATDREIHATSSPVGGPMGAGQAAAAAPTGEAFRVALWSDGTLEIRRSGSHLVKFSRAESRAIVDYLDSISLEALREGAA